MSMDAMTFGEVLTMLLREEKLSRLDYAAEIGKTPVAVHKLVNDDNSPTIDRALALLSRFGCALAIVRERDGEDRVIPLRSRKADETVKEGGE